MISIERFIKARPFLYHLTDKRNIALITKKRRLFCATHLLSRERKALANKRCDHVKVIYEGHECLVRDQRPLHAGNVGFSKGMSFDDLLLLLNGRVFFWPGNENGPISYGVRHFERYKNEGPAIIRIPSKDLRNLDESELCKYNSGSPRWTNGTPSPRGPETFMPFPRFEGTPSKVIEVTFKDFVSLPETTQMATSINGPWRAMF